MIRKLSILALPLVLGGCMEQNLGLESQHKPIVADGIATVPHCPDWSSQGVDSAAGTDSNYGCATNSNLAAMIANPQDLVHGAAAPAGASSDIAPRVIGAWRSGPHGSTGSASAGNAGASKGPSQ